MTGRLGSRWLRQGALTLAGVGLLLAPGAARATADTSVVIVDTPRPQPRWGFTPTTVSTVAGSYVTWSNAGQEQHTVTASDGSFDSGALDPSQGFSLYFDTPGSYAYLCALHPWMRGTVMVADAAADGS